VRLSTSRLHPAVSPDVVLKAEPLAELLEEPRTGAVVAGPGLGRDDAARERLAAILAARLPSVIDADALVLLDPAALASFDAPLILTPHAGEMKSLAKSFGLKQQAKVPQALELARAARAVVVSKGPDTVIAAPDGRVGLGGSASFARRPAGFRSAAAATCWRGSSRPVLRPRAMPGAPPARAPGCTAKRGAWPGRRSSLPNWRSASRRLTPPRCERL
jgi:hypothetical protein